MTAIHHDTSATTTAANNHTATTSTGAATSGDAGHTTPRPAKPAAPEPASLMWVEAWDPETAATAGTTRRHGLRSDYVEEFWLPVLGPSSIALLRLLDARLTHAPAGFTLELDATARALGIGHRSGRNGPMVRTVLRCASFGALRLLDAHRLLVARHLPELSRRQLSRLPADLADRHPRTGLRGTPGTPATAPPAPPAPPAPTPTPSPTPATPPPTPTGSHEPPSTSVEDLRRRCRALALSLVHLGEDPETAEVQLHRWHFHPAMAHESVTWALGHAHNAHSHITAPPADGKLAS